MVPACWLLAAALPAAALAPNASTPPSRSAPAAVAAPRSSKVRDVQLTVLARHILETDAELGPLNLGIDVREGVATLWGRVPADPLIARALDRVRGVHGVLEARSDLYVGEEDAVPAFSPAPKPTQTTSASLDPDSGGLGTLARRPTIELPFPTEPPAPAPSGFSLRSPSTQPPKAPSQKAIESLAGLVDRVRAGDERFRTLRVELHGRTVTVGGPAARTEDVIDLARALSSLPGVESVAVRNDP